MTLTAPLPTDVEEAAPPPSGTAADVRKGGWFVRITIIVVVALWLVPTLGVLITSFRPQAVVNTSGWWTVFAAPLRLLAVDLRELPADPRRAGFRERVPQ